MLEKDKQGSWRDPLCLRAAKASCFGVLITSPVVTVKGIGCVNTLALAAGPSTASGLSLESTVRAEFARKERVGTMQ
jgi:hypothetical protein